MGVRLAVLSAVVLAGEVAFARPSAAPPDNRWVVLATRPDPDQAIGVARASASDHENIRVLRAKGGSYAVVSGPERVRLRRRSRGDAFVAEVWASAPQNVLARAVYTRRRPAILRVGSVRVTLAPAATGDLVAVGRAKGSEVFRMELDGAGDEEPSAELRLMRLDASTPVPQVVFTSNWRGPHCCTQTSIATLAGGAWREVVAENQEGDGYAFEDLDGDGTLELIGDERTFLETYGSFAESSAPRRVFKLLGDKLVDVTGDPKFQAFRRQDVFRLESYAERDPGQWTTNGFLAAWVAAKALVGEFEEAWARMLSSYDSDSAEPLIRCPGGSDPCAPEERQRVSFPDALRAHLAERGYIPPEPKPPAP